MVRTWLGARRRWRQAVDREVLAAVRALEPEAYMATIWDRLAIRAGMPVARDEILAALARLEKRGEVERCGPPTPWEGRVPQHWRSRRQ